MSDLFWILYRIVFGALFGLLIGSFLNVCIYRLPRHETIVRGHSYCPGCHHELAGADLVPIFGCLFLRGRCRYCAQPISPRYARIESVTGVIFALPAGFWGGGPFAPAADKPAWLAILPDPGYNALVIVGVLAAFCALLVWAMILFDEQLPPRALYGFILVPALLRLALQPDRILLHLAGAAFAAAVWWLLETLRLLPEIDRSRRRHVFFGLALLGLTGGLIALQPVMAAMLVASVLALLAKKPEHASRLVHLLLPAAVLASAVLWLFL